MALSVPKPTRFPTVSEIRHLFTFVDLDGYKITYEFDDHECAASIRILRPREGSLLRHDSVRRREGTRVIHAEIACGDKPMDIDLDFTGEDGPILLTEVVEALTLLYHAEEPGSPHRKVLRAFYRRAVKLRESGQLAA